MRIVSAYRPTANSRSGTGATVLEQHRRYFRSKDNFNDPRIIFLTDLEMEIEKWKAMGEEVIVCLDANEDGRQGPTFDMFTRQNMQAGILARHQDYSPPETCNKNHTRTPIDGIFSTSGISIARAGYDAFDEGCPSDDRIIYIDVTKKSLYGFAPQDIYWSNARRLTAKDPRRRKAYNKIVKGSYKEQDIYTQVNELKKMKTDKAPPFLIQTKHKDIHKQITRIRLKAAKKTRKLEVGGTPWSPKIQDLRHIVETWHWARRRFFDTVKVNKQKIVHLAKKCYIKDIMKKSQTTVELQLKQAKKDLKAAKLEAPLWRHDHLNGLASAMAQELKTTRVKTKKILIHREKQKNQHRRINRTIKKTSAGAAFKIFYQDDTSRRKEAVDKDEIEQACIAKGLQCFTQCQDTPVFQTPLIEVLGTLPDDETVQKMLYGQFDIPPGTNVHAAKLLRAMKLPANFDETSFIPAAISTKQHVKQWQNQNENKAAEPSGPSFSHYIAGSCDNDIAEIDALMRSIPREVGFSPEAWQVIKDFQILKKAGVFDIQKMRIIQLMHSEFNANNKHDRKTMMSNAEAHKSLEKDQFGSRKNHRANLAALGKLLFFDILRQQVLAGAVVSNDAKSCYERIALVIAFLAMARQGVAYTALYSAFDTLRQAVHHIQTGYGTSERHYGGKPYNASNIPIQGIGQGNGAGPAIWAVISTVLVTLMLNDGFGSVFLSAISLTAPTFVGFLFVDDTDLIITTKSGDGSSRGRSRC